ncbi:MAG: DUF4097 family beta strand repeat-containing protein [Cecembia sp.]
MKLLIAILILVLPVFAYSMQSQQEPAIMSWELPMSEIDHLQFKTAGLSLNFSAWDENRIVIEVMAQRGNEMLKKEDAQLLKKLELYEFDLKEEDKNIFFEVLTEKPSRLRRNRDNIILFVRVQGPAQLNSLVKSESGSITLSGMHGRQELRSEGGSIRAINCAGELVANSAGGSFFVDTFQGKLSINAAEGSVRIENFNGELLAKSMGGSMSLFDISGKVTAESDGGSIRANFIELEDNLLLKSTGGSIDAVLPRDLSMTVNFSGSIVTSQPPNFQGESKKTQVKGTINGGGIPIHIGTSGANVRVDFR